MFRRGLLLTSTLLALQPPCAGQEQRGQAEVAIQGYYRGGSSGDALSSTGAAANFRYFFDKAGMLEGRLESYRDGGRLNTGENYLRFGGVPWKGYRWSFGGGDFRLLLRPEGLLAGSFFLPDVLLRGGRVEITGGSWTASAFAGHLMVMQGPRMPYLRRTPQSLAGGSLAWKPSAKLHVLTTAWQASTDGKQLEENPYFLPPGRTFTVARQLVSNVTWTPRADLTLFAETGLASAQSIEPGTAGGAPSPHLSVSLEWHGARWQTRASYVSQPASFMPLAGYFSGDRRGPYTEVRYQLSRRISAFSSASSVENNLERQADRPTMHSTTLSGGIAAELPGRLQLVANLSSIGLKSLLPSSSDWQKSGSRMAMLSLSRTLFRNNLRGAWREVDAGHVSGPNRLRSYELDDSVALGRLTVGGGVRLDQSLGQTRRDSLSYRGSLQMSTRRFSAYAFGEFGRDLLNETLFLATQIRSTVLGASAQIDRHWTLNAELMRNSATSEMNDQSIFLLSNLGAPISLYSREMNRWTLYFRLTRSFQWGPALPAHLTRADTSQIYPVMGVVEGFVFEKAPGGPLPAAQVPVTLDGFRTELTDSNGRFRFADVPQGSHKVALSERTLPAEFNPASASAVEVPVMPRRTSRVEFTVARLLTVTGKVVAPPGVALTDIVIRLAGSKRYTTPDESGSFAFYNLPGGRYELRVDIETLPEGHRLSTPPAVPVTVTEGEDAPDVLVGLEKAEAVKPVRRVILSRN